MIQYDIHIKIYNIVQTIGKVALDGANDGKFKVS